MKQIILSCISFLIISISYAAPGELPTLALDDGANRIALTLYNRSDTDIPAVSTSVEKAKLPAWLSVQCEPRAVNAPRGSQAQRKLFLNFTVKDAPVGAEALVPLVLRDAFGNTWNYTITVRANTSHPLPDALIGNYPNPFNPDTVISFSLSSEQKASLVIYNTLGQKVRVLADGFLAVGKHSVRWDGKDEAGRQVSSGVYYYKLTAGRFHDARRMVLLE